MAQPQQNKPYAAIFIDRESRAKLLRWWASAVGTRLHPKVFATHVTLIYDPTPEEQLLIPVGHIRTMVVTGWSADDLGQAVLVQGSFESKNPYPHITMATFDTDPVYSNTLLARTRTKVMGPMLSGRVDIRND